MFLKWELDIFLEINNLLYLSGIPHSKVASSKIIDQVVKLVEDKIRDKN